MSCKYSDEILHPSIGRAPSLCQYSIILTYCHDRDGFVARSGVGVKRLPDGGGEGVWKNSSEARLET